MTRTRLFLLSGLLPAAALSALAIGRTYADSNNDPLTTPNSSGVLRSFSSSGALDASNPFFQSLGSNGRACVTCHQPADAWSITPEHLKARFEATHGTDPVFRTVDGANSPQADVSTVAARRKAYSMLLNRGVIRVGLGIPAGAEFTLSGVNDPYHFASAHELSLFRRPLPSTNLRFLTAIMWDGRETILPFVPPMDPGHNMADLIDSLKQQAADAVSGHAQGTIALSEDQLQKIVAFELGLTTAQLFDNQAGFLNAFDALGGPRILANQQFFVGANDTLGADPTGAAFNPSAMTLFSAWSALKGHDNDDRGRNDDDKDDSRARRAIARGQALFNTKPIQIAGVGGLNDALSIPVIPGTCTTCHSSPNVGNHSVALPINIGISDASRRTADMPLYTLRNNVTGAVVQTTDPGRALITGKWKDIGKFKGPILRGLAARAPYFHNGSAATLAEVVDFYDTRFTIGFTRQEKSDMEAFLRSL